METPLKNLVGRIVKKIFINNEYLKFETDKGDLLYTVYGDCCSSSYFYDFYGVKNLLSGSVVTGVKDFPLDPTDLKVTNRNYGDEIQVYGFQITTSNEDYGEVTSVFSFRNASNGYYGGSIEEVTGGLVPEIPELTDDVVEIKLY